MLGLMIAVSVGVALVAHFTMKKAKSSARVKPPSNVDMEPDLSYLQTMPDFLKGRQVEGYERKVDILYDTCMRSSSDITPSGSIDSCNKMRNANQIQLQTNNNILVPGMAPYLFEKQKCDRQFNECNAMSTSPANNEFCRRMFSQCKAWAPTKGNLGVVYPTTYPVLAIKS